MRLKGRITVLCGRVGMRGGLPLSLGESEGLPCENALLGA